MKTILVVNAKGGVGKTTVATTLAGCYAARKKRVYLVEMDPQGSALDWLRRRRSGVLARIWGIDGTSRPINVSAENSDYVIIDAPAAVRGLALSRLLRRADLVVIPVLPSPIDMQALSSYLKEIRRARASIQKKLRIGVVANRIRSNTNISAELHHFLIGQPCTYLSALRDSTNYIRSAASGQSIFESRPSQTNIDRREWLPITRWIG